MSETEKSGTPPAASADLPATAPAPAVTAPAKPAASETAGAFSSFGANRGSGLARGKRPTVAAAAPSASAVPAGYKPSSVSVITSQSEYKNPFTGETSVTAPRANEPTPPEVPLPSVSAVKEESAQAPVNSPIPESSASLDAVSQSNGPEATEPEVKPELKILPPEGPRRTSVRWESTPPTEAPATSPEGAPPRADERRTFQPSRERREGREAREGGREGRESRDAREPREGREGRPFEPRQPREGREHREPRRDERSSELRPPQPQPERRPQPLPEPEKKSGGFMGWLKGIFGGGKPAGTEAKGNTTAEPRRESDQGHGQGGHRGGRGRGGHGGQGGFRGENRGPQGEPREGGDDRGEGDQNGRRRRRRRGGRGRSRGEGGDQGPRPEGQQGGGAI